MVIYYEIGNLETKLSKKSISTEICRKQIWQKCAHLNWRVEGLVYLLEENQNGFFSKK